jgi:hypothetical protein
MLCQERKNEPRLPARNSRYRSNKFVSYLAIQHRANERERGPKDVSQTNWTSCLEALNLIKPVSLQCCASCSTHRVLLNNGERIDVSVDMDKRQDSVYKCQAERHERVELSCARNMVNPAACCALVCGCGKSEAMGVLPRDI